MAKNAERPMVEGAVDHAQVRAARIVDGILDGVERAGYFTGARKMRRLGLEQIVHRDGRVEDTRERLIAWTRAQIEEWLNEDVLFKIAAPPDVGRAR